MAAPAGGFADKIGNRYEAHYVVEAALGLIDGDRLNLRWEGVGDEFRGVEYRSRRADGKTEVVQCKSSRDKNWTPTALANEGVLTAIRLQLTTGGADLFTLVLASRSGDLASLTERARASSGVDAFWQLPKPLGIAFNRLLALWGLTESPQDQETGWLWLSRVRVCEHSTLDAIERAVERRCGDLFDAPSGRTLAAIREVLEARLGEEITADLLIAVLRSDRYKISPRDWGRLPDQVEAVRGLRERFSAQLRRLLIRGRLIPRAETETVLKAINDPQGAKVILLHGAAGNGKSGVLYEAVERLAGAGICVVPLRLDNALPEGSLLRYSRETLQLPDTPVRCATRLSPDRQAVIVIDQLDAVRWAGVHSTSAWDVTLDLLESAGRAANLRVIVACRTFDVKDDPQLRMWKSEESSLGRIREVEVKPLEPGAVDAVLKEGSGAPVTARQLSLLRNPLMLSLWCDLTDRGVDLTGISASSSLLSEHWKNVKNRLTKRYAITDDTAELVISNICKWAGAEGRLDFPAGLEANQAALDALASESYLDRLDHSRLRVAHQRYLDHQIALSVYREVLMAGKSVADWLRGTDQSLMRREQVRQVLALLRDGEPSRYATALEALIFGEGVREHIRDLVLKLLAEVAPPFDGEVDLVLRLLQDARWAHRVRQRTLTTPAWWRLLIDRGVLQRLLVSEQETEWKWAAWICGRCAEHDSQAVSTLLVNMSQDGCLDTARRLHCLPFGIEHDTPEMAAWRFAAQRRDAARCELYEVTHAAKEHPEAALFFSKNIIRWELAHIRHPRLMSSGPPEKFERWSAQRGNDLSGLRGLAVALPRKTWTAMAPLLLRSLRWLEQRRKIGGPGKRARLDWNHPVRRLNSAMRVMLSEAAAVLAPSESAWLWEQLQPFLKLRSRSGQCLCAGVIGVLVAPIPEAAVEWLVADVRRFGMQGNPHDIYRYWHGRNIVRHVWDVAPVRRDRLVGAIGRFHDRAELELLGHRQDYVRRGRCESLPNLVGLPQYLLLSSLPPEELDNHVKARLAQWDAKFCTKPARLRATRPTRWFLSLPDGFKPGRHAGFRSIRDLIPPAHRASIPDDAWIAMADPKWSARMSIRWKARGRFSFETPTRLVEMAFREAAKTNPARFVRLVQRLPLEAPAFWFEAAIEAAALTEPAQDTAAPDWRAASAAEIEACLAGLASRGGKYLGRSLARLVQARATEGWSDATISRICDLAVSHEDPKPDEYAVRTGDGAVSDKDVFQSSFNCTRGVAVAAVERLMWHRKDKRRQLLDVAEMAVRDPHPAVRVAATNLAGPLLNDESETAIRLLDIACSGDDVRVLGSWHLHHLLKYLWWRGDARVEAIVERMINSGLEKVEHMGAFFATVAATLKDRMKDIADRCAIGNVPQRKGVATALARLTGSSTEGHAAAARLATYFDDDDPVVAGAAASVFRDDKIMTSPLGPELATKFVTSKQFARDPDDFTYPLSNFAGDLLAFQPVLAGMVKRATGDMAGQNGDIRRSTFRFADKASECVLRIYERAQGREHAAIRSWCLDQIDTLVATGDSFGEQALRRLDADA